MKAIRAVDYAAAEGLTRFGVYERVRRRRIKSFWINGTLFVEPASYKPAVRRRHRSAPAPVVAVGCRADVEDD